MKKIISLVLLLSLCLGLFAGCDLSQFIPGSQPNAPASNLENAKSLVFNTYKPANKDEVPFKSTDFEVMTAVLVEGESFPVAWTVEVTEGPADAVKIVDGSSDAFKKVDLTEKPEVDVKFTLTATISDAEGNTATVSFNYQTPKFEAPSAEKIVLKVKDIYITGTEYLYTGKMKYQLETSDKIADAIAFTLINNEDGSTTFKTDDGYYLFCDANHVQFVTEESDNTKFVLEVTDGGYFIKCAVANYNGKAQYLEYYSSYLTCYGMGSDPSIYTFALEAADGANGKVTKYSDSGSTEEPTEPTTPSEPSDFGPAADAVAPVAGTAYKLGLVHGTNAKTYYISGGMASTYYLATNEAAASGLDAYIEAATNGYYLYVMENGAKKYINMTVSGTHVNAVYADAAETVYTYDETLKTLKVAATVEGETADYILGTRNDKTYSTVGFCTVSSEPFYCQFFAVGSEPSVPDVTEPQPTEPEATEPSTPAPSTPEEIVDAAYGLAENTALDGTYTLTGKVIGIDTVYSSTHGNVSVVIEITGREDKPILCYRMKGDDAATVKVCDVITVTGVIKNYNGKVEFDAGCTFVTVSVHTCTQYSDATCLVPATCVECGLTVGEVGDHNYVDGVCGVCGTAEGVSLITATQTMKDLITANGWTSSTTKQSFNLDDNVSVKINGGSNTGKAYNGDHIRIYATDSPAGTITISVAEGYELVSVKVSAQTGTYAFLYVDGTTTDICNQTVSVSGNSVLLNSVKNGSDGKQVRVTAIEVIYKAV